MAMPRALVVAAALLACARGASSQAVAPPAPVFACCVGSGCVGGASNDDALCDALSNLYYSANGAGWVSTTGWASAAAGAVATTPSLVCVASIRHSLTRPAWRIALGIATDFCTFAGVVCGDYTGEVIQLSLANNNLAGTVPPSIGSLTALRQLCVGGHIRHLVSF